MHHMRCEVDRWRPIRFMIIAMFQAGSNPKLTLRPFSSRTLACSTVQAPVDWRCGIPSCLPSNTPAALLRRSLGYPESIDDVLANDIDMAFHVLSSFIQKLAGVLPCVSEVSKCWDWVDAMYITGYISRKDGWKQGSISSLISVISFRSHGFPTESLPLFLWQLLTLKVGHKSGKSWADRGAKALKFWGGEWICLHILGCFWKDGGSDAWSIPDICCYTFHRCLPEHGGWSFRPRSRVAQWHHVAIASITIPMVSSAQHGMHRFQWSIPVVLNQPVWCSSCDSDAGSSWHDLG